jgi:hypothetical protein
LIFHCKDKALIKILATTVMNGDQREVNVTANQQGQLGEEIGPVSQNHLSLPLTFSNILLKIAQHFSVLLLMPGI